MDNRYSSLTFAIVMLMMAAHHWAADNARIKEARTLALQVEAFVKKPLVGTATHNEARHKARDLVEVTHGPYRRLWIILHASMAIQSFEFFFRDPKGKKILAKMARIWTRRP